MATTAPHTAPANEPSLDARVEAVELMLMHMVTVLEGQTAFRCVKLYNWLDMCTSLMLRERSATPEHVQALRKLQDKVLG